MVITMLSGQEHAHAQTADNPRVAPADAARGDAKTSNRGLPALLTESFEGGAIPPTGWTTIVTNPNFTWEINDFNPQDGTFYASTLFNVDLVPQEEWLISPAFNLISGELDIWHLGSPFWCIEQDNCDPEIWLLSGDVPNIASDVLVYNLEDDWPTPDPFIWTNSLINLDPFVDGSRVRIGIRYVGNDGAEVSVDNLVLRGEERNLPESQPVPVNNLWALGLMALLLAGLGTIVIRRMF